MCDVDLDDDSLGVENAKLCMKRNTKQSIICEMEVGLDKFKELPVGKQLSTFKCITKEEKKDIICKQKWFRFNINNLPLGNTISIGSESKYHIAYCKNCEL